MTHHITAPTLNRWSMLSGTLLFCFVSVDCLTTVHANEFLDDATLTGTLYFWNRDRDRKDLSTQEYEANLRHSTVNAALDFKSGYLNDIFAIELGGYGSFDFNDAGPNYPNEISFSDAFRRWDERYTGDKDGVSYYKAQANLRVGNYWAHLGMIQPSGLTLLTPHWSLLQGTYQGAEIGAKFDFEEAGVLETAYIWANRYKAPWYINMDIFREWNAGKKIDFVHAIGAKYDFKNHFVLEASMGQAHGYMDQYVAKASYQLPVWDNPLSMSYQFYGAHDQDHGGKRVYDGLAWLQAVTFHYPVGYFGFKLEGVIVKAEGEQGFFLQRMTPDYASSNGRLDIWWNARSDFNANGEKAIFAEVTYDLAGVSLPGWKVGASYAYGWGLKPNSSVSNQGDRLVESAWNLDVSYVFQSGTLKDTALSLHYTNYDNHSNIPSYASGYGNLFQDERDIKFLVTLPFSLF